MGLALLLAVPFLSLILIRILWSGSTLWFLIAGVLMLGWSAYAFISRRNTPSYGYQTLSPEPNRMPVVLLGIGALFLALLILPHASSGSSPAARLNTTNPSGQLVNSLPVVQSATPQQTPRATAQPTRAPTPSSSSESTSTGEQTSTVDGETYVIQDGDTLWDIASRYGVSVDDIVAANHLDNAADLTLGQEIVIPASSTDATDGGTADTAGEPEATPTG